MSCPTDPKGRDDLVVSPKPMRRGSLSERYVKCSKKGCACAENPDARHGPYYSLTRGIKGRTRSRFVSAEQAQVVRRQIEDGRCFRKEVEAYWGECELLADQELESGSGERSEGVKKGGSRKRSKGVLSRKSRRS